MKNFAASNRARLLAQSKELSVDFLALLIRYTTDRLLYRLSLSKHQNSFVLKGSLLFSVWNEQMHRPTKDADLLGFGAHEENHIRQVFTEICSIQVPEDGLAFDLSSLSKDFYDIKWLADHYEFDGKVLNKAISATFERRKTPLPTEQPIALSDEFYRDDAKRRQWNAFARKLKPPCTDTFNEVGARVMKFLLPPLQGANEGRFDERWTPDKGWLDT